MSRHRTPIEKAFATGRVDHDPKRYRSRGEPDIVPLGEPSPCLGDIEVRAWHAFRCEISWLAESDRAALEAACLLRARVWLGTYDTTDIAQLRILLSTFGATPADRSRIALPPDTDADDPAADFIN